MHPLRVRKVDRGTAIVVLGAGLLTLAVFLPWYVQPSSLLSDIVPGRGLSLVETTSPVEIVLRILVFGAAVMVLAVLGPWHRHERSGRRFVWGIFPLVFILPYVITQWDPDRLMDSNFLYYQMDRVVQDMEYALQHQQRDWRDWQHFLPLTIQTAFKGLHDENWQLILFSPRIQEFVVTNLLGMTNAYFAFACRGWVFALVGGAVSLFGFYVRLDERLKALAGDLLFGAAVSLALLVVLLIPRGISEYYLHLAEEAEVHGQYREALAHWEAVYAWRPAASEVWSYYERTGRLTRRAGCEICVETYLSTLYDNLVNREYQEALETLQYVRRLHPERRELRYWFGVVFGELGIAAFNEGQYSLARDYWESALQFVPIDPLSWYGLWLVHVRLKEYEEAVAYLDQVVALQAYLTFKRLTPGGQRFVAASWAAYARGDWRTAHALYSRSLRPETW